MFARMHRLLSPPFLYAFLKRMRPWLLVFFLVTLSYGLFGALVGSPADYQQGDVYRIIYIHVPLAVWSLGIYVLLSLASLIYLIWHHKVADMIACVSVPIGLLFTLLTLITGSIWGKPTWGTWWIWDARLTTETILLFIYIGIFAVRRAVPEPRLAARIAAVVTLLGAVDIPLVHYSVVWWHTLHQGPSVLAWQHPLISPSMFYPLIAMIAAFGFYFGWVLLVGLEVALIKNSEKARWVSAILK